MAFRQGRFAEVTVNAVALSTFCDNMQFNRTADTVDVTTFTATDKSFLAGLKGGTLTLSGDFDGTVTTGPASVLEGLLGAAPFAVLAYPGGNTTGQRSHSFNALITAYSETSAVADKVSFSATLLVTGAVTSATI
jgi:hypothetical protein